MTKYTPEQIERVIELREAGKSFAAIQRLTGVHHCTASYHCLKLGAFPPGKTPKRHYKSPVPRGRRVTPDEEARMLELARDGLSAHRVSQILNRPINTVKHRLMVAAAIEEAAHG